MSDDPTGRLHPEGAPGIAEALGRTILGDSAFELQRAETAVMQAHRDLVLADAHERRVAVTVAIKMMTLLATVILVAVAVAAWRWAL